MQTPCKGNFKGNAMIMGSAECLFADYQKAKKFFDKYDIIAVNFSGICFKNVVHLVSLHADRIPVFLKAASLDNGRHIHTHSIAGNLKIPEIENDWGSEILNTGGSSALFAVRVALKLGYDKIIVCGVPLNKGRRFYDTYDYVAEVGDDATFLAWKLAYNRNEFEGKVRSMSGKTKFLLGEPTIAWANES